MQMFRKAFGKTIRKDFRKPSAARHAALAVIFSSAVLLSRATSATPSSSAALEFPVTLRQNVVAGTTPVGAKVQAKLVVATLVNGIVIPQDAILSGEITESAAKSATSPSRLAIRMDSAQWKNKSAPIKVYLTVWYYPAAPMALQDHSDAAPLMSPHNSRHSNGIAIYPSPNPSASQPFPGRDPDARTDTTPAPGTSISEHRVLMNNVEFTRNRDGAVTLTSKHFNIKLDKQTTYVLAAGELAGGAN
jgi:hypothetical protein